MEFEHSDKVRKLQERVAAFMAEHVYPNEEDLFAQVSEGDRWQPVPLLESLKAKARAAELWNLFLPQSHEDTGGAWFLIERRGEEFLANWISAGVRVPLAIRTRSR